jgi:hypothetical protein
MSRRRDLVAKRHAAEVCAQQFGNDATSTALSNYIKGAAWINKNPQPPARSADPPAGLVTINHRCLAQFFGDGVVLGLDFGASRSSAWESLPALNCRLKQSPKMAQVFRMESPLALFRSAAKARARGPSWTPAAPVANDICKGWLERTL